MLISGAVSKSRTLDHGYSTCHEDIHTAKSLVYELMSQTSVALTTSVAQPSLNSKTRAINCQSVREKWSLPVAALTDCQTQVVVRGHLGSASHPHSSLSIC